MNELVINLHMHTLHSDGHRTHEDIAFAALAAGLDAIIVTDHNVWVDGPEGYYEHGQRRLLLLVGEEVHDTSRKPEKSHLLIFGADRELNSFARHPQKLIDEVNKGGGLSFIAHPVDPESSIFGEPDLSWDDWKVHGYTGIELWNAMSEFKSLLTSKARAIYYAFNPKKVAVSPFPDVLKKWEELLIIGHRVVAIGGSDAHEFRGSMGPLQRILFPYEFHFRAINTHLLVPEALNGDLEHDKTLILEALQGGHAFVGYDLPASTRGFRFEAQGKNSKAIMGDEIQVENEAILQICLPQQAECILLLNGKPSKIWTDQETCTYKTNEKGAYRVEVYLPYKGKRRGWIFSNPIYII